MPGGNMSMLGGGGTMAKSAQARIGAREKQHSKEVHGQDPVATGAADGSLSAHRDPGLIRHLDAAEKVIVKRFGNNVLDEVYPMFDDPARWVEVTRYFGRLKAERPGDATAVLDVWLPIAEKLHVPSFDEVMAADSD